MSKIDLIELAAAIPTVLQYFIPGYIFIKLTQLITFKKTSSNSELVMSCVFSFIFVTIGQLFVNYTNNMWIPIIISIAIGIGLALLFSFIYNLGYFHNIFEKIFKVSLTERVWESVIDFKNGTGLKIYLRNKDFFYAGSFGGIENNGVNSYLYIVNPIKVYIKDFKQFSTHSTYFVINLKDVEYMEVL